MSWPTDAARTLPRCHGFECWAANCGCTPTVKQATCKQFVLLVALVVIDLVHTAYTVSAALDVATGS